MRPVLGRPALLQKILQAMIADWTVLDQSFFLCKQNFPKLVVCAGKVQNADVLIHQKILAGMCVFLHLRLLSSTILSAKQYTKKSAPSLQRDRPVFLLQKRYRRFIVLDKQFSRQFRNLLYKIDTYHFIRKGHCAYQQERRSCTT